MARTLVRGSDGSIRPVPRPEIGCVAPSPASTMRSDPERPMRTLPRALSPLRHAHYRRLAASLACSLLGQGLWAVAVVWQVVALDGGPAALSLVTALSAGGMLGSTLLGGALADRVPQRHILLGVELTQGLTIAAVAGLSLSGVLALGHLAGVALVGGIAMGLYYPA